MSAFDITRYHRERTRRAEQRADGLAHVNARLVRLLALAVQTAAGQDCEPLVLLRVLEETLDLADAAARETDEFVQLLRDTDPDRTKEASSVAA